QAQVCNPVCANQPKECCQVGGGGLLLYECSSSAAVDFTISDKESGGTIVIDLTSQGVPPNFSVAGLTVNKLKLRNSTFAPFTIGTSAKNTRFISDENGQMGQCVAVSNFSGLVLPNPIVVANRALTLSKSNPFFCRSPVRDVICFQVKGQVGAPFPDLPECNPDRVEYACGIVS